MAKAVPAPGGSETAKRSYGSTDRVEQVIHFVLDGVRRGRYAPGQRISEVELAEKLNINRAPVREGLRILAGEGVTELVPQRGARIRKLSRTDLGEMVHALTALNEISAALATERRGPAELDATLTPILERTRAAAALDSHSSALEAIEEYHRAIHDLGGNKYILYLWNRLHVEHYHRCFAIEYPPVDWAPYLADLEAAHAAMLRGDAAAAKKHFQARAEYISTIFAESDANEGLI